MQAPLFNRLCDSNSQNIRQVPIVLAILTPTIMAPTSNKRTECHLQQFFFLHTTVSILCIKMVSLPPSSTKINIVVLENLNRLPKTVPFCNNNYFNSNHSNSSTFPNRICKQWGVLLQRVPLLLLPLRHKLSVCLNFNSSRVSIILMIRFNRLSMSTNRNVKRNRIVSRSMSREVCK